MTRRSVLETLPRGQALRIIVVILGSPESANYTSQYLEARADAIVIGKGGVTYRSCFPLARFGAHQVRDLPAWRGCATRPARSSTRASTPSSRISTRCPSPIATRSTTAATSTSWKTHHGASSIDLITARGCAYRCNWCSHAVYGHSHRRRSPANVADEMQWIIDRTTRTKSGTPTTSSRSATSWLADYSVSSSAAGFTAVRDHHTRRRLQNQGVAVDDCASSAVTASGSARRAAARRFSTECELA